MHQQVVLNLVSDLSIALACAAIAAALIHVARRPTGLPYGRVFLAFALFVVAQGVTHLAAAWTLWQPSAWLATALNVATAVVSVTLALLLPRLVPNTTSGLGPTAAVLDATPDAIVLVDDEGAIRLANERAERLFGYARGELVGRPSTLLLPSDVRVAPDVRRDASALRRDGSRFAAEITVKPLFTEAGRLFTAVVRDITDRQPRDDDRSERGRAETARLQAEETGRRALFLAEASRVLAASLDYEATLRSVARVAIPYLADYVLVDVLEPRGRRLRRLAAAHPDPIVEERLAGQNLSTPGDGGALDGVIERGEPTLIRDVSDDWLAARGADAEHLGAHSGTAPTSLMLVPLRARGRTLGVVSFALANGKRRYTLADLTLAEDLAQRAALAADNARLYREAQDASRAKDEFLAVLSHELRTPLTPVLGWVRILKSGTLAPEATARALDTVERNTRLQAQLVEDLLDVSRIIAGKLSLDLRPVALGPIVDGVIESTAAAAAAKSIVVNRHVDPDLPRIEADANRLQQVLANLLSNAVKFTPVGGRVDVAAMRVADTVRLAVADTGDGLAPDVAPHIFDRFRQADSTITRQYGGLGLGLSIVRHIVERHGGTVDATSEGIGRGATFTVTLPIGGPVSDAAAGAQLPAPAATDLLADLRVLVVDDDADTRELVAVILQRAGADVAGAGSTDEALRHAEQRAPDVVVSDLAMPARDGYALLRALHGRGLARGLVTIALTAHARREDRERALGAGYDAYVTKPVEPAALAALVKELVEKRRRSV